ncbi:uncharacterized protein LOC133854584 [Alnus glutinosa]|uniref:uncharacterized protein LOC133854584 n=1 Tax=Alnus glutinosa TaxID=3517 RepID=UPI002D773B8B|nr:uncharacterized protein LOC133854584 [Alnus glutinosa]
MKISSFSGVVPSGVPFVRVVPSGGGARGLEADAVVVGQEQDGRRGGVGRGRRVPPPTTTGSDLAPPTTTASISGPQPTTTSTSEPPTTTTASASTSKPPPTPTTSDLAPPTTTASISGPQPTTTSASTSKPPPTTIIASNYLRLNL